MESLVRDTRTVSRRMKFIAKGLMDGEWSPPPPTRDELSAGLVLMIPGIEGRPWQLKHWYAGVRESTGFGVKIVYWRYKRGLFGSLHNLVSIDQNRRMAAELAEELTRYRADHPDGVITLVGYSGGGGVALLTLDALPAEATVDRVVLVHSAIDPCKDLTEYLRKSRHGIHNFHSSKDWFYLGVGTRVFGTIDRRFSQSAGRVGFRRPERLSDEGARLYESHLTQVCWTREMAEWGHTGGHLGPLARGWVDGYLAPMICGKCAGD